MVRREGELGAGRHAAERAAAERPSLGKQKRLGRSVKLWQWGSLELFSNGSGSGRLPAPGAGLGRPDKSKDDGGAGLSSNSSQEGGRNPAVVSASWAWRTPESVGPAGSWARSLARISPAKVGSWRCSTGSVSAHDAQYAAGASATPDAIWRAESVSVGNARCPRCVR